METNTFKLPDGSEFQVPVEWLIDAEIDEFVRQYDHYRPEVIPDLGLVPLASIQPMDLHLRQQSMLQSGRACFGGFDRQRMINVLRGIVEDILLPPILLKCAAQSEFTFAIYDGTHRFYASIVAGFTRIAAGQGPTRDISEV